ncbi:S1 domain-containing RNA-binding protein [Clostridium luticellarii]|jgi:S1 RNA binding domain protein|uniref:30S ribosomal protein S1 n=1 Tax=Clostridium luticellarii TaxID=1691940 RepID=A0A2T0BD64_9CLOT|nr:S1 domain-containing RNA-binding protein [Clostridium luticellarii]MCI1944588.1 S1 domain-containing RNA-binding protein [Clostridium luticellarii]MCI1968087.1 S1 domain-containing RNA-binding protein [Clostridium luticellarii]MCI1994800.1 S1 domain-containing RNA-binding protein [Clostridium luticellarii]MCI2039032.1 S1 domain-containing RNA-binding protein [Clostridium luticellarii]PRR81824.1 30S ribosomal protein S1 [Clostridium luticellarii]
MTLKAGNILEGTVVNITSFGAFVEVEGKTGLVHISEVSDTYVKNIRDYLKEKDKVKVKVISIDDNGKISLSMKQVEQDKKSLRPLEIDWQKENNKQNQGSFEDRLSKFLKDSEERFQDIKKHQDSKGKGYKKSSNY